MSAPKIHGDLSDVAEYARDIINYSTLLGVVLAGPDADTCIDGMHSVMLEIRDSALSIQAILERVTDDASKTTEQAHG